MMVLDERETFVCRFCGEKCFHRPILKNKIGETYFKTFTVFQCERCDNPTLMRAVYQSLGAENEDPKIKEKSYFPPLIFRMKPNWYDELEEKYRLILDEVYEAVDVKLFTLASSGVRTAIDSLLTEVLGDIGGFKQKLKALLEKDIVTREELELLDAIIDAGSASIHRGFSPDNDAINSMLEITEHVFHELCIRNKKSDKLKKLAENLRKITPKR